MDTYIRSGAYGKLPDLPYVPGKGSNAVVCILQFKIRVDVIYLLQMVRVWWNSWALIHLLV